MEKKYQERLAKCRTCGNLSSGQIGRYRVASVSAMQDRGNMVKQRRI